MTANQGHAGRRNLAVSQPDTTVTINHHGCCLPGRYRRFLAMIYESRPQASGFRPRAIGSKVPHGSQIPAFLVEDNGKISLVLDKTILRGLQHVGLLTIPFHLVRGLAVLREILDVVDHGLMLKPRVKDGNPDHMNVLKSMGVDCRRGELMTVHQKS